jgi:hypothetical protein
MTELTPEAQAKLDEIVKLSEEITDLENKLGIDPTHKRDVPDGLYAARLDRYVELYDMGVPYPIIAKYAGTHGDSVRAMVHKRKAKAEAATQPNPTA